MKKVYLGLMLLIFFISGCSETDGVSIEENTSTEQTSESEIAKNELEELGLTYGQSIDFDNFCQAYSENISNLQEFDNEVQFYYDSLDELSSGDILISVSSIESAYLDNGGEQQDKMVSVLQENTFSFYNIAKNMYEYQRGFTETEAAGNLIMILPFVEEIGVNYNLSENSVKQLKIYFLNNINSKGNFTPAIDEVMKEYE